MRKIIGWGMLWLGFCATIGAAAPATCLAGNTDVSATAAASEPTPEAGSLVRSATYSIAYADGELTGEGASHLLESLGKVQFVLVGESHFDHDTPILTGALYQALSKSFGFHHLVVEQDPLAIEDSLRAGTRGDAMAIAAVAKRDPYLIGFASDQDLQLLANVGQWEKGADPIWGLEQVQGTTRYLRELSGLASTAELRFECERLLTAATQIESSRGLHGNYLSDSPDSYAKMQSLRALFAPAAGSREQLLLEGLVKSTEIYSYYRRADAGEYVGLFNNTVRESLFKQAFMEKYHRSITLGDPMPKALFKFGDDHMIRGLNPDNAYPIGNFAHEFAIANGQEAYSIDVLPLGRYSRWADLPSWVLPVLPRDAPKTAVIIDLRALRPYQKLLRAHLSAKNLAPFRAFINGYDAVVLPAKQI